MAVLTTTTDTERDARIRARHRARAKTTRVVGQQVIPRIVLILMCGVFILPFYWCRDRSDNQESRLAMLTTRSIGRTSNATEAFPIWKFLEHDRDTACHRRSVISTAHHYVQRIDGRDATRSS